MVALQTAVNTEGPDNAHQTTRRAHKAIANSNPRRATMARTHRASTLIRKRRAPEGALSKREVEFLMRSHLGYRGLIFEQIGVQTRSLPRSFRVVRGTMLGPDGARRSADEELEDFLFRRSGPLGKAKVAPGFQRFLAQRSDKITRTAEVGIHLAFPTASRTFNRGGGEPR